MPATPVGFRGAWLCASRWAILLSVGTTRNSHKTRYGTGFGPSEKHSEGLNRAAWRLAIQGQLIGPARGLARASNYSR